MNHTVTVVIPIDIDNQMSFSQSLQSALLASSSSQSSSDQKNREQLTETSHHHVVIPHCTWETKPRQLPTLRLCVSLIQWWW